MPSSWAFVDLWNRINFAKKDLQNLPSAILLALLLASNSSNLRQLVITHSSQATKLLYRVSECVSE